MEEFVGQLDGEPLQYLFRRCTFGKLFHRIFQNLPAGAFAFVTQGADKGDALAALLLADKLTDLFLHHSFGFGSRFLAGLLAVLNDAHHVINSVEISVAQLPHFGFDIARNGKVEQKHGHIETQAQCAFHHAFADQRELAGGRGNDDIVFVQDIGQLCQQARLGIQSEFVAQLLGARQGTVGNGNEFGTFGGEIGGDQFNHFARADK